MTAIRVLAPCRVDEVVLAAVRSAVAGFPEVHAVELEAGDGPAADVVDVALDAQVDPMREGEIREAVAAALDAPAARRAASSTSSIEERLAQLEADVVELRALVAATRPGGLQVSAMPKVEGLAR